MPDDPLLAGLKLTEFKKDFFEITRAGFGIDDEFIKNKDISKRFAELKKIISQFNKKYPGIHLKLQKRLDSIKLRIFFEEKGPKQVFENAASKIAGLKSIGTKGFNEAEASSPEFAKKFEHVDKKLFLQYQGEGSFSVYLEGKNKVELHYEFSNITNDRSPDFRLCAYYALNNGYKKSIDVYTRLSSLGFSSWLSKEENRQSTENYYPNYEE